MIGLLFIGFLLWMLSPIIGECFIFLRKDVIPPIVEWLCGLIGADQGMQRDVRPFVVSEHFSRIEKATLDILESQEPVDKTIILWWGLDGLRLDEDGSLEWISRKKSEPTKQMGSAQFTPPGGLRAGMLRDQFLDSAQCTRVQIDAVMAQNTALQMQAWQSAQIANSIHQCCVQYPAQYPSYYYGGCCR